MKNFLTKNKKHLGWLMLSVFLLSFVILPIAAGQAADAPTPTKDTSWVGQVIGWVSGKFFLYASSFISMLLGGLFGLLIGLEGQIIDYILSPSSFPFTSAPIVTLGWGITRDLANMFFILILLIIAFATVLRIKSWAISQLWWKVVVAALLINFSLVIAGFVIDLTQILTGFFLHQITGGGVGTLTTKLAASMQILNFYNPAPPESIGGGIGQFAASGFAAAIGIILTLVGLVVTAFVFGAAVIFLVVRILWLWLLLIFAPIVWMLWILPATSSYFSQWWHNFLKWSFFAPVFVFMIYLSLSIFDANGKFKTGVFPQGDATWGTAAPGLTTGGMPAAIFQWILVIGLMFASLIVAQKFGVYGAAASTKMLTGWGTATKNWAGKQLRRGYVGATRPEAPTPPPPDASFRQRLGYRFRQAGSYWGRGAEKVAALPGGRFITAAHFKMVEGEAKSVEDTQKQFGNWSPQAIQEYLSTPSGTATRRLGAALALQEKGKLDKIDPDPARAEARIKELISLASRYSSKNVDKLLETAPHLATEFNKNIESIVAKIKEADKIMLQSLNNSEVVLNFNPTQLRDIAQKADDVKVQKVKDVVDAEFAALAAPIKTEMDRILSISNKDRRNRELNAFLDSQTAAGMPRTNVQKLEKIARSRATTKSPAWQI